ATWDDTGRLVNAREEGDCRLVHWGDPRQALGAVHANGSTVLRSRPDESFLIPDIPFGRTEAFRERTFPHPLLYVPQPLAHFAVTRQSARPSRSPEWEALQTMLL